MIFVHDIASIHTHLKIDEDLLALCEITQTPFLRLWECTRYAAVLGKGNQEHQEVAEKLSIPVVKRESGGGSVILGPGCLNYSMSLPILPNTPFQTITTTTTTIMNAHATTLSTQLDGIAVQGVSDLTYHNQKVSGNAQRRKKNALLFHGTFLYNFDLTQIYTHLKHPPKEPDYRLKRPHESFLTNLPLTRPALEELLRSTWANILTHL